MWIFFGTATTYISRVCCSQRIVGLSSVDVVSAVVLLDVSCDAPDTAVCVSVTDVVVIRGMGCRETNVFICNVCLRHPPTTTTTTKTSSDTASSRPRCCRHRCVLRPFCEPVSTDVASLFVVVVLLLLTFTGQATALPMSRRSVHGQLVAIDALRPHAVKTGHSSTALVTRYYKLYSRSSQRHLRLTTSKVDACANFTDPYTNLRALSTGFQSQVRIQSVNTGNFLCFNIRGRPVVKEDIYGVDHNDSSATVPDVVAVVRKPSRRQHRRRQLRGPRSDPLCVFHERHSVDGFTELQSAHNQSWYIGFSRSGEVRRVDVENEANARISSVNDHRLRQRRQFVKTDFAYVDDPGASKSSTSAVVDNRRTGVRGSKQRQGDRQERHDYHGPAIDYMRVFTRLRSTSDLNYSQLERSSRKST